MKEDEDNFIQSNERLMGILEDRLHSLDNTYYQHSQRAAIIFGFGGVIISVAFSIYANNTGMIVKRIFFLGMIVIFASLLLSVLAIRSRKWKEGVNPDAFDKYKEKGYQGMLQEFIRKYSEYYKNNLKIVGNKARIVNYAFYLMFVGLFLIGFSIF